MLVKKIRVFNLTAIEHYLNILTNAVRKKWDKYWYKRGKCILLADDITYLENLRLNWTSTETHVIVEKSSWLQINRFPIYE